jgi:hypothetical protein
MKRFLILILLTGSLLLLPKKLLNACGFMSGSGEYRFWILQPDITNEQELTPFFFASTYLYKQDAAGGKETYLQKNIEEWFKEIHKKDVSRADIDSLLNHTSPDIFFEKKDSLAGTNSFMRYLLKNSESYRYIQLSKKVEAIAANPDPWDEGAGPNTNVIQEAKTLEQQTTSSFIKMRTAFQLMRLYNYSEEPGQLCNVYDSCIAPVPSNSWIKSAGLYLKAIRGRVPESDRLLAQVFDKGDYNRSYCLIYVCTAKVDSLVAASSNTHERTVLRAMQVFNSPGRSLSAIKKIYAAEPYYKEIPFLLLREINKVEDWLLTNQLTDFKPAVYNGNYNWRYDYKYTEANLIADKAYAVELNKFLLHIIEEKKNTQPALLHLYAAHLSMLTGDYTTAEEQLNAIASRHLPANVKTQLTINRFLLGLESNKMNPSMEKVFLNLLQKPADQLGIYDADIMKDQLILYTARKMIRKGDKAKGWMLLSRTRRALGMLAIGCYKDAWEETFEKAEPADYDNMIAIVGRKHKTPFEEFITKGGFGSPMDYYSRDTDPTLVWNTNRLLDGKSSWYLRNNNVAAAAKALHNIPDSFWQQPPYKDYTGGNPFYLNVYQNGQYYGIRKVHYNKRTIVNKMMELQTLASGRAENYFQMANAWYNMSWYGNNWLMVKTWWSTYEIDNDVKRSPFNDFYYGCNRARDLYLRAMRETKDKKLATLCCFMAGRCDRNQQEYLWNTSVTASGEHFVAGKNPYLYALKEKGIEERFYREMVKECALYNDYIKTFDR